MDRCIRLILAYDGTAFHGWQRQAGVRTVQEELEHTLRRILRHPLHVDGASRTDAGVHARGQVATVRTDTPIPAYNLARAIGDHLPRDIALLHVRDVPLTFHPSRDARRKLYRYRIHNAHTRPVYTAADRYAWHVWYPLDRAAMQAAADHLVGRHDFTSFATQGSPRASNVRTLYHARIEQRGVELHLDFEGDGFLYNQVRIMVGTLVAIGRGRWPPTQARVILEARTRAAAATTAPPQGLCLQWVRYAALGPCAAPDNARMPHDPPPAAEDSPWS